MQYRDKIYKQYATYFQSPGYKRTDLPRKWATAYRWYLRRWLPKDKESRVLDIGCGGGQLLGALRMLGYRRLAGVDVSAEQVERARLAGLDATVGEGFEYLNRTKSTWDFVLAVDVVEHLNKEELLRFIDQVAASLSPGGRFVIQTPNPDSIVGMRVRYGDLTHEVSLSPDCLTRILRQSGFASVEAREAGPIPNIWSPINTTRYILWKIINYMMRIYDIVETGSSNAQVFTRVYLISAVRCMKA